MQLHLSANGIGRRRANASGALRADSISQLHRVHNAVVARRQLLGVGGGVEARVQSGGAGNAQAVLVKRRDVFSPDIIGPNLCFAGLRQMRGEEAPNRTASNDANPHYASTPSAW